MTEEKKQAFRIPAREADDIRIRPAGKEDMEEIAKIHVDTWQSVYRGIIPDAYLETLSYAGQRQKWETRLFQENGQGEQMYVLEEKGEIMGFVSGWKIDEERAEINTLYLKEKAQRKGYGSRLLSYMLEALGPEKETEVWCFAENGNRAFYEAMGGRRGAGKEKEIGGRSVLGLQYLFGGRQTKS